MRREDRAFDKPASLLIRGSLLTLARPWVMGILNLDPSSFYSESRALSEKDALEKVSEMIQEGMDILDIGPSSSRPGAEIMEPNEEWKRLESILKAIQQEFPAMLISVDTLHSSVAQRAIDAGADMINDISGGMYDPAMIPTVAAAGIPYVCMHMPGEPATMQHDVKYENVLTEVISFFTERMRVCKEAGIKDLILDPGFGFGKKSPHNFTLLRELNHIRSLRNPVLIGISRKRMIYGNLGIKAEEALNGTTALNMAALMHGADILRVHDVKEAVECVKMYELMRG